MPELERIVWIGRKIRASSLPNHIKSTAAVILDELLPSTNYTLVCLSMKEIAKLRSIKRRAAIRSVKVLEIMGIFNIIRTTPQIAMNYCNKRGATYTIETVHRTSTSINSAMNIYELNLDHPISNNTPYLHPVLNDGMFKIWERIKKGDSLLRREPHLLNDEEMLEEYEAQHFSNDGEMLEEYETPRLGRVVEDTPPDLWGMLEECETTRLGRVFYDT